LHLVFFKILSLFTDQLLWISNNSVKFPLELGISQYSVQICSLQERISVHGVDQDEAVWHPISFPVDLIHPVNLSHSETLRTL